MLLLGALSLLPALLIMVTAFTRIVIVLGFARTALGTQGIPPNQVMIGLALFLTLFVMAPAFSQANDEALQPLPQGRDQQSVAFDRVLAPFREFMLEQVRDEDLPMFVDLAGTSGRPEPTSDIPTTTLVPAFVISELRAAFLIGFVIFIPFVVIDLVVSAALSAMGMAMLPPVLISLPFKLLLFVAADGWSLIVQSLVSSFQPDPPTLPEPVIESDIVQICDQRPAPRRQAGRRRCSSVALVVGLVVSLLQAVFQAQDQTLSMVPAPGRLRSGAGRDRRLDAAHAVEFTGAAVLRASPTWSDDPRRPPCSTSRHRPTLTTFLLVLARTTSWVVAAPSSRPRAPAGCPPRHRGRRCPAS